MYSGEMAAPASSESARHKAEALWLVALSPYLLSEAAPFKSHDSDLPAS